MDKNEKRINYLLTHAKFKFEALPEDLPVKGNCSVIDDETDKQQEQWIYDQLSAGNLAAWFCAKVTCSYLGIEASNYLGGCSYESFGQFTEEKDGYFADMKRSATQQLIDQLESAAFVLSEIDNSINRKN